MAKKYHSLCIFYVRGAGTIFIETFFFGLLLWMGCYCDLLCFVAQKSASIALVQKFLIFRIICVTFQLYEYTHISYGVVFYLGLCTDCSKKLNYNTRYINTVWSATQIPRAMFVLRRHKEVTSVPATIKSEPLSPGPPHDINADISDKAIMTDRTEEEVRLQEKAIWERPAAVADDSSRDSDFDQYLAGLIL